jgi:ubiquinone/menaquinone biosynthesis C-methylase UbiE
VTTDWRHAAGVADGFNAYDDLPERVIGYPKVFAELRLGAASVSTLLDYGCGPGKVALRAVSRYPGLSVRAVDISARMIEIARTQRRHERIEYELIDEPRLANVADGSVDAAMSCYVFINIGELRVIQAIVAEVYRTLRPGGRYVVLDTNPDTTGIRFSTFRSGDPGRLYHPGESRSVQLYRPDGPPMELSDHHWPRDTYLDVFRQAGFGSVEISEPLLDESEDIFDSLPGSILSRSSGDSSGPAESVHPPFLIVTGMK